MKVSIDTNSGFCFGVVNAIQAAERVLEQESRLYCLGDIVHNNKEVERLTSLGLEIISHEQFQNLRNEKVLIRAHGEPPETYKIALKNGIELIDASCPVVLKLQNNVRIGNEKMQQKDGQLVIYGKQGHAEVAGLAGQTSGEAIVVNSEEDLLEKVDFSRPVNLFSQTTQSIEGFNGIVKTIEAKQKEKGDSNFVINDTICRQVSHRAPQLRIFSQNHDVVVFVSGRKSSNGKYLYGVCKETNPRSFFISSKEEIDLSWFKSGDSIGICGATSTPRWLMDEVAEAIDNL
ncbi:MAG: 4-hydroxy-3-methylbut-2-enyl diphosphate reductase [Bacteroidetes bacterium]|nr:MAG: 4-hydroxy-3-methylbut-2-enyl diphosphate reductase [Bacteroidota bacterium]